MKWLLGGAAEVVVLKPQAFVRAAVEKKAEKKLMRESERGNKLSS